MSVQLSKDADSVLCVLYSAYLDNRKQGKAKADAKTIGQSDFVCSMMKDGWKDADVYDTFIELSKQELTTMDIIGNVILTDSGVIYMEQRPKEKIMAILDIVAKARSIV